MTLTTDEPPAGHSRRGRFDMFSFQAPAGPTPEGQQSHAPQPHRQYIPEVAHGSGQVQGREHFPEKAAGQQEKRGRQGPLHRPPAGETQQTVQQAQHQAAGQEVRPVPGQQAAAGQGDQKKAVQEIQPGDDRAAGGVPPQKGPVHHQKNERISRATMTAPTTPQKPMPS